MFYLSGKNSDSSNEGRPPYFEYINCLPYLQGSSAVMQTWSTCNESCVDNNWKPIRDVCVANAGTVDFNYSFIKTRTSGTENEEMFNCAYGGEATFGYTGRLFEVDTNLFLQSRKTLSMDAALVYSTGSLTVNYDYGYGLLLDASTGNDGGNEPIKSSVFINTTGGSEITGITGMTGQFGASVSQKNGIVAVGAYLDGYRKGTTASTSTGEFGKVYIYNTGGQLVNEIYAPQGREPDEGLATSGPSGARGFGHSVAIIDDGKLLIGAPWTSGFYNTTTDGTPTSPAWVDKAGASYIYSTGGEKLHTLTGETGSRGLSYASQYRRLLGWQGIANESSLITAGAGIVSSDVYESVTAIYTTNGAHLRTIGPYYSTEGFEANTIWRVSAWSMAANEESLFINNYYYDSNLIDWRVSVQAYGNDGTHKSSIDMPTQASVYVTSSMDASSKYLTVGDIKQEFDSSILGAIYTMETGDLFLKEVLSPNSLPSLGIQVAVNENNYAAMNESGVIGYTLSGEIPFNDFTGQVGVAFEQWKGLFESSFTGATINFVNLGRETGTNISSNSEQAEYPLDSHIGNIRIGMQSGSKPATAYCPQGTMNVSGVLGGDIHLDRWGAWRQDGTPTGDAPANAYSIVYAVSQAIGSSLGFGTDSSSGALMYDEIKPEFTFTEKFPNGLSGSIYEKNAVMGIYGV